MICTNDQEVLRIVEYVEMTGVRNCGLDMRKVSNLSKSEMTKGIKNTGK